ncbi:MAG: OmpH family outer membrane protein [Phycisphaeraceae bacterium]|nr:OmpH family outer membrane protein [Phycisphaeraceae bacterium]
MKRTVRIAFLMATLCLLSHAATRVAFAQTKPEAGQHGRPTAIAVVDVERSMNAMDEMTQIQANMNTLLDRSKNEELDRRKKLEQLQQDLQLLQAGTDAFRQKSDELQLKAIELDSWSKFQQGALQREQVLQLTNLYRKLLDMVGKVAGDNGFDMVIFKEKDPEFRNVKPDALSALISLRKVLWVREDLDLTDQVILRMNNEWKNNKK